MHRRGTVGSSKFCVDDRGAFHLLMFASGVTENPSAQQIEAGPAIHRALGHLQPVDVALDLAAVPRLAQGGAHQSSNGSGDLPFTIPQKRVMRLAAVAMDGERSRKAWTKRGSSSVTLSGSPVRSRTARQGVGGSDRFAGAGLPEAPRGSAGGSCRRRRVSQSRTTRR